MSIMPQPLPSRCAAMPRIAPMVTTPVPPTPSMIADQPSRRAGTASARARRPADRLAPAMPSALRILAPCTVTKDGQKPLTQEKSLLQLDWSMRRLRPNSVSTGWTETQFDCTPQSPQPSQTSSLMITRLSGSGKVPRLRRRRFSAAQVWS